MSHLWTFSPSSETQLQHCINAATSQTEENKWTQFFAKKPINLDKIEVNLIPESDIKNQETIINVSEATEIQKPLLLATQISEEFYDLIEAEPVSRFDYLTEECLKNEDLITTIAEKLSESVLERICNLLLDKIDVNVSFLNIFYLKFVPVLLKREYMRFSLDFLVKSNKTYPVQFRKLLEILLKDLEIPNKVLQDFVQTLVDQEKVSFMNFLTDIELNKEQFVYNIFIIYTVYKDITKTVRIQHFILYNLVQNYQECITERNYGRLLLSFLQAQKAIGPINDYKRLENIIESHKSPFRKPCMTIFKEILEKYSM